jgi:hypothetical protein
MALPLHPFGQLNWKESMKFCLMLLAAWMGIGCSLPAVAGPAIAGSEAPRHLQVLVPESAGSSPQDRGVRSHTRLRVLVVPDAAASTVSQFNTPAALRSVYRLPSTGGSGAIAIVDSYHFPTAQADFNSFSKYFGLPQETSTNATATGNKSFQVVYATGYKPQ